MLRVNLMADEDFRSDIMEIVHGHLRNISRQVITEILEKSEFLNKQIVDRLETYNFAADIERWLRYTRKWEDTALYAAITKLVEPVVETVIKKYIKNLEELLKTSQATLEKAQRTTMTLQEDRIRQIIAEELRKRLS